jgi:type II secretory pathway predicted ATPase ExeA
MYTAYYGLDERPFDLNSSSRFLYLGEIHKEALASLVYGVAERKGFMLLTGEAGVGKTTTVQTLIGGFDETVEYVHLSYPLLSPEEFIHYVSLSTLGKATPNESKGAFLVEFGQYLNDLRQHRKTFLLIIDEAQGVSFELLEAIRLLSNAETAEEKLINIILVGQPELKERLIDPRCKALFQRVCVQHHLKPLDQKAVGEYIRTRLSVAGARNPEKIISESVVKVIYRYSNGYPREINNISDNVLLLGYVEEKKSISPEMVTDYCEEMKLSARPHPLPQEVVTPLEARGADPRPGANHWKRFAHVPILLIAMLVLALGLTRTGVIGRMASLMRTDSENPAVTAQEEKGEQGPIAWDTSSRTAEDLTDFEFEEKDSSWTVTVKEGDTLRDLALEVYGRGDPTTLEMLMKKNPAIDDVDMIIVGQRIAFPPLPDQRNRSRSSK